MVPSLPRLQPASRPALFLDRDGIVNIDHRYVHRPDDITLTETAARGIRLANESKCWVIVVTNQSGVARGLYDLDAVRQCHRRIDEMLAAHGAHVDAYYISPYHEDGIVPEFAIDHPDRKPRPGMLWHAMQDFPVDRGRSILFGDKASDVAAGRAAGIAAILLPADVCDLASAVSSWIDGISLTPAPCSSLDTFQNWIEASALPCWAELGFDRTHGRFRERLDWRGMPLQIPHRAMVQARQIYVYAKATTLGWIAGGDLATSAMVALQRDFGEMSGGMTSFAFAIDPANGRPVDTRRDAYSHAFVLFAIASLYTLTQNRDLLNMADRILCFIDTHLMDPVHGGMISVAGSPGVAKAQNPQMHLLEAYLALAEATGRERYLERSKQLIDLFQERLFDRESHILPEWRGADWSRLTTRVQTFEPGHHYEWAWLLGEYERLSGTDMASRRDDLVRRARNDGAAPCGLLYDEVGQDGDVTKAGHRIWQQTEALRTCLAQGTDDLAAANRIAMLLCRHFLDRPFSGGWIDHLTDGLAPQLDHVPASTLYHLVSAACVVAHYRGV